jgi:glyoxylase-like metal-dependent hydrolase (beta-lactamase superfamily II)
MKIHPIITNNSLQNIFYILECGEKKAIVIDPSDSELTGNFLEENSLKLESIFITHEHDDHYS